MASAEGVLIPSAEVRKLMLREDTVDVVRARQFHNYAVTSIDEGIELLTGKPGGELGVVGGWCKLRGYHQRPREQVAVLVRRTSEVVRWACHSRRRSPIRRHMSQVQRRQ